MSLVFVPVGILFVIFSNQVQEYSFDYTDCANLATDTFESAPIKHGSVPFEWRRVSDPESVEWAAQSEVDFIGLPKVKDTLKKDGTPKKAYCEIRFNVEKEISGPIFLYYRLKNFYQNQRLYVRSLDARQLKGEARTYEELRSTCDLLVGPTDQHSVVYYPCGLIANSMFTDVISGLRPVTGSKQIPFYAFEPRDISVKAERKRYGPSKYSPSNVIAPPSWKGHLPGISDSDGTYLDGKLPDFSSNERFQNWMNVAGLPVFRKTYGRHDGKIPTGTYQMIIFSQYDVDSYGASKSVVISNTSWIGGKNPFLGYAYICVGAFFLVVGLIFLGQHLIMPRRLGDPQCLSWNKENASSTR